MTPAVVPLLSLLLVACLFDKPAAKADSGDPDPTVDSAAEDVNADTTDDDGDGYSEESGDCDDNAFGTSPGAVEACGDGVDNNCDELIDEACDDDRDGDGDGYSEADGDCDDRDALVSPDADEQCDDGQDNNCDGRTDEGCGSTGHTGDADGDGYSGGADCNGNRHRVNPGEPELCRDAVDNNCDGTVDERCAAGRPGDTGTAYLFNHGTHDYDGSSLSVSFGLGAKDLANNAWVCDIVAEYRSTSPGPPGCPACTFAFHTQVLEANTYGAYCSSWAYGGDVFAYYTAADFWWSDDTIRDGWGWADAYTYVAGDGTEYDLEDVLFDHITYSYGSTYYNGWYFRAYNFPAGGVVNVVGDASRSDWQSYSYSSSGSRAYYYFYY